MRSPSGCFQRLLCDRSLITLADTVPTLFLGCVITLVINGSIISPTLAAATPQTPGTTYTGPLGAVATVHPKATELAVKTLEEGGSAADAAIAAALALGVVDGFNSGIGGGLFAITRWADGSIEAIDGRETAPAAAKRDMYLVDGKVNPDLSRSGALASGIPGSVAAFAHMHTKAGKVPLGQIYNQAATLADQGFGLSPHYNFRVNRVKETLAKYPESAALLLDSKGNSWPVGHHLKQPALANTYRQIGRHGADWFYSKNGFNGQGFGQKVEQWMQANAGNIKASDFQHYELKIREPIRTRAFGLEVVGFPPPSSGGIHIAQMLALLENAGWEETGPNEQLNLMAQAMRLAFADRSEWVGDPGFVNVPDWLLSKAYLSKRAGLLARKPPLPKVGPGIPPEAYAAEAEASFNKHTTHLVVADRFGNWVSMTSTVNTTFGSKVLVPGTGVFLNNQMDDFVAQPGVPNAYGLVSNEYNAIAPGKRPLSSMSPTLILKDGQPLLALGAAGGPMIINQVLQTILRNQVLGMPLDEAMYAPRLHHQWQPDTLYVEKTLATEQRTYLNQAGHTLKDMWFEGSTNAVEQKLCPSGPCWVAVSEPRLVERNKVKD